MTDPRVCKHWKKFHGYCMFGETCKFAHPADLVDQNMASQSSSEDLSVAESRRQIFPRLKAENDKKRKEENTHRINNRLLNRNKEGAFRRWLLDTFGLEKLQSGSGIIDVAGGKGALSFELSNLNGINCTIIDPRPLNLKHYKRRLQVGLYHRTQILQVYNNKPAPTTETDIILPNHIRIFMDQPLLDILETQNTEHNNIQNNDNTHDDNNKHTNTEDNNIQNNVQNNGEEFFKEAITKGRSVCWSKKGLVDGEEMEETWKYESGTGESYLDDAAEAEEETSDSHEITMWDQARQVFEDCSVAIGLHPDQATEAIVDFALARKKAFAVIPCCVYHKEFPKRRFPDGTPISKYEDFVDYLVAKDPTNIRKTVLDIEGKNTILYYQP